MLKLLNIGCSNNQKYSHKQKKKNYFDANVDVDKALIQGVKTFQRGAATIKKILIRNSARQKCHQTFNRQPFDLTADLMSSDKF